MAYERQAVERFKQEFGVLTDAGVLKDMIGFLKYAIRNELPFITALGPLSHDINGLARYGFDLRAATKDAFLPKVTGFSKNTADEVDEPNDE